MFVSSPKTSGRDRYACEHGRDAALQTRPVSGGEHKSVKVNEQGHERTATWFFGGGVAIVTPRAARSAVVTPRGARTWRPAMAAADGRAGRQKTGLRRGPRSKRAGGRAARPAGPRAAGQRIDGPMGGRPDGRPAERAASPVGTGRPGGLAARRPRSGQAGRSGRRR